MIRTLRMRLTLPAFFRSALTAWRVSPAVSVLVPAVASSDPRAIRALRLPMPGTDLPR